MIMFPLEFVPTIYPGYVWNVKEQHLYTYKLGTLRKLPVQRPNPWNQADAPFYSVSHLGKKRRLWVSTLKAMSPDYNVYMVPTVMSEQLPLV